MKAEEIGRWTMKKTSCVVIMTFWIISLMMSSSYALDNKGEKTLLAAKVLFTDTLRLSVEKKEDDRYKVHQPLVFRGPNFYSYEKTPEPHKSSALDLEFSSILSEAAQGGVAQVGMAFITNLALHELGHKVVGDYVGATGTSLNFLKKLDNKFFLGHSSYEQIDEKSILPFSMAGEVATDMVFEHALKAYRKSPNIYNKSLLFFSGTDFLWYSSYAFYLSKGHPHFDPISISKETGISRDMLFSVALAKTIVNAYRVYSGQDKIIPYFTIDKYSAFLNIGIPF